MLKGNKGEWSETYTFFKLLGDGILYGADANLNRLQNVSYSIIKIIRSLIEGTEYHRLSNIEVYDSQNNLLVTKTINDMLVVANEILQNTLTASSTTYSIPSITTILEEMHINSLKAKNTDKRDITIKIHDAVVGSNPTLGFSIKSQLGKPATLLNASGATNVIYKLANPLSDSEIQNINNISKLSEQLNTIYATNNTIEYYDFDNHTFKRNLLMMDYGLPELYANIIKVYFLKKDDSGNTISNTAFTNLIEGVSNNDPLKIVDDCFSFYSFKFKELLTNVALGFMPATAWNGSYDATGGYIIVKNDGDIVCYHIYNRNEFRDYLFNSSRLDTPSRSKHGFGTFYNNDGETFIKLNAQIRSIK